MRKFRSFILLVLLSAVVLTPLKVPSCPKQNVNTPIALSNATHSPVSQQVQGSCSSSAYWFSEKEYETSQDAFHVLIGLLFFSLVFSKYMTPIDTIYRPPIRF